MTACSEAGIEWWDRASPKDIMEWYLLDGARGRIGYSGKDRGPFPDAQSFVSDLERWWAQYQVMGIAKRIQAPPVLAVKKRRVRFRSAGNHKWSVPRYTQRYFELKSLALPGSPARMPDVGEETQAAVEVGRAHRSAPLGGFTRNAPKSGRLGEGVATKRTR